MEQTMGECISQETETITESGHLSKEKLDTLFSKVRLGLEGQSTLNPNQTFQQIFKILAKGNEKIAEERQKIEELASFWVDFNLEDLYDNVDVIGPGLIKYYQVWMLTARVLMKVQQFFKKLQWSKPFEHEAYKGVEKIAEYMSKSELQYSPGKNFLVKKAARFTHNSYKITSFTSENQEREKTGQLFINEIYDIAQKEEIKFVVDLFVFLAQIGVIDVKEVKPEIQNEFMHSITRIRKREQKEMFIHSFHCQHFEVMKKAYQQKNVEELRRIMQNVLPNYCFYKNEVKIRNKSMTLDQLQAKYENYDFLEDVHDYVQWMFPNHYGSAFNSSSKPLNYIQSELFLQDSQVRLSLLYSIMIFTDFMGLRYNFEFKQFSIVCKKRLRAVILVNFHNHLRIMRILACLSVTGFRSIALSLIDFLDKQTRQGKMLQSERNEFNKSWKIYGNDTIETAYHMCFLEKDQFQVQQEILKIIAEEERKMNIVLMIEHKEKAEQEQQKEYKQKIPEEKTQIKPMIEQIKKENDQKEEAPKENAPNEKAQKEEQKP